MTTIDDRLPFYHLDRMTDSTGLIQHAIYAIPRRESGYTTDDNARALRLCTRLWSESPDNRMLERVSCYLSFLEHARCSVRGFHNLLSYQRDWLDAGGTGDCQGQAMLALCEVLASPLPPGFRALSSELIETSLPALAELRSLRAQAYLVQAWALIRHVKTSFHKAFANLARSCADRLMECYHRSRRPDWPWFESRLTYANAALPHALFNADLLWPGEGFRTIAESTFAFLDQATTENGVFWPVGNRDWFSQGEPKSLYDQQPVEAATMAAASMAEIQWRGNRKHAEVFRRAYAWFHGENSQRTLLADPQTGACFDGLQPHGANQNQGAESTLAYLWTEMLQRDIEREFMDFPTGAAASWQSKV